MIEHATTSSTAETTPGKDEEMTVTARLFRVPITVLVAIQLVQAQKTSTAAEAKNHIGEATTVCGEVASTHHATTSRGSPTFINLDKSYPNEIFTVLIWGSDRSKFGNPDQDYRKKRICATGHVTDYKGVPEIVAHEPTQIKVQ
jgi:micrococcal nuclease